MIVRKTKYLQKQKQKRKQRPRYIRDAWCSAVVHKAATGEDIPLAIWKHNVTTTTGIDQLHINGYTSTSRSGRGFNVIAVTQDTTQTINSSQTALTGEMTTLGFARVNGTPSHSNGTNQSTVTTTFTATGTVSTAISRSALFDINTAPVSGNMGHIAAFATDSGTLATNDTLTVTWTILLS